MAHNLAIKNNPLGFILVSGSAALLLRRPRPNASVARAASARPVAGVHIGPTQRFLLVPVRAPPASGLTKPHPTGAAPGRRDAVDATHAAATPSTLHA